MKDDFFRREANVSNDLILKRFFSKKVLEDLLSGRQNEVFDHVVKRYISDSEGKTYSDIVSEIYCYLGKNYRTEYYYKNTLLNKLLLKRHNYKKTVVLTELPISDSKADFVMINGKGVVYEIKTELDNLERLNSQVNDYYKAFQYLFIVTYEKNVDKVINTVDRSVGIIILTKRGGLNTYREAQQVNSYLSHECIFRMLRKYEFENIIQSKGLDLPKVSQFEYYKECFKLFKKIEIIELHTKALSELKNRMKIEQVELTIAMPQELRFLSYFDEKISDENNALAMLARNYGG